jgi:ATP-binding cassette, subfamily B, multidrug efflux pump
VKSFKVLPKNKDIQLLKRLLPFAKKERKTFAIALALLPFLASASAVQPLLVQKAIDGPISSGNLEPLSLKEAIDSMLAGNIDALPLYVYVWLLVASLLVQIVFQSVQGFLVQKAGQKMTASIRQNLFDHVLSLSSNYFSKMPVGKLITRLTSDVEALGDVFSTGAVGVISDLFAIVVVLGFMAALNPWLALILFIWLIPITVMVLYFQRRYRAATFRSREELSSLNAILQENILGINVVQLFRREKRNNEYYSQVNNRYIKALDETILFDSSISALMEWAGLIGIALLLWFGGIQALDKTITLGVLLAFIQYAQRLFNPIRQITEKFTVFQSGFTSIERLSAILDEPVEIKDIENPQHLPLAEAKGKITFEHVSLAYKEDETVLKNLNFTIKPGEKVALVGPTGAGKSSIIRLLSRLYEPSEGRILIDGVDITQVTQAELRNYVGVILQDGFLFSGDVASNIALGDEYAQEKIEDAARRMNVDSFIQQLPQGYQTEIRERGNNLSSGQKQLLAFARAAVRYPPILVLDEATASLDVSTEALVQEALDRLLEGRTAIIIAHRLTTIRNVDRILVLKRGELVEEGNHDQLMQQNGLYASLYRLQMLAA